MTCEFYDSAAGRWCNKRAVRPVQGTYGECSWRCAKHGRGRKTYKIYRPVPTVLERMAAINDKRKWWEYAYEE